MIQIVNKIYLNYELHVEEEFQAMAASVFLSETETIDFGSSTALQIVNDWVESRTSNSVQNMLRPGSLENSEIMIVNAIRFRGMWQKPFSRDHTSNGLFYVSETESVAVDMMHGSVS